MTEDKYEVTQVEPNASCLKLIHNAWNEICGEKVNSYFLSWGWIEAWIQELPKHCKVHFVQKRQNGKIVLAFFVGRKQLRRIKIVPIEQLCLNTSGDVEYDKLCVEFNGFLYNGGGVKHDLKEVLNEMPLSWDEITLPGVDLSSFPGDSLSQLPSSYRYIQDYLAISPYVDLQKVRQVGDYLSLLSSNSRYQIKRSFRILEKLGNVELIVPDSLEQAFEIYRELIELHQSTWNNRGEPGAFSSKSFCRFHERLIKNRFKTGEIQFLRIHAGGETVGCLYSFLWKKRIYFYQCGINYNFEKKVKPGLVSHVMAVEYYADKEYDVYDFLAGDDRYKKCLATDTGEMVWGRIQRRSLKIRLTNKLGILAGRYTRQ